MKRFYLLPLLFLLLITGCKDKGKTVPTELLFISNIKYFTVFPESRERQKIVQKTLGKRFKINKLEIKNFESIEKELEKFLKAKEDKKGRYILFAEPFIFPIITNSSTLSRFNLQVVSYGIGGTPSSSSLGLFHICISRESMFNEIKLLMDKENKKTGKPPVILFDEQNGMSKGFKSWWDNTVKEEDIAELIHYRQSSVSKDLESAMNEKPGRTIFLFAGVNNRAINMVNREKFKNKNIIEIFTRYGKNNKCVSHYIDVEYNKMLKKGLKSQELNDFILNAEKNVINFEIKDFSFKKEKSKEINIVRRK